MKKRNTFIKTIGMVMVVIFSFQCTTISTGKLIDIDKKVDESPSLGYNYKAESIRSIDSPATTLAYRIIKVPRNRVEALKTYEKVKYVPRYVKILTGIGIGILAGLIYEDMKNSDQWDDREIEKATFGFLGGITGMLGGILLKTHKKVIDEVKEKEVTYVDKPNAAAIPFANQPIEVEYVYNGYNMQIKTAKKFTDNDGKIFIDIKKDFDLNKLPAKRNYTLNLIYVNAETSVKASINF